MPQGGGAQEGSWFSQEFFKVGIDFQAEWIKTNEVWEREK
jgi:hypothetical protein